MQINKEYKDLEKQLVDSYNTFLPLFDNVPPNYNKSMPKAIVTEGRKKKECSNVVTFSFNKSIFRGCHRNSPMAVTPHKNRWYEILVNKNLYKSLHDFNKSPSPLFHEMLHVKKYVLGSDDFLYKKYPDMDLKKAQKLFDELNPVKNDYYHNQLQKEGYWLVMLCHFLAKNIIECKDKTLQRKIIKKKNINDSEKMMVLIKRIYFYRYQEIVEDAVSDLADKIRSESNSNI